MSQQQKLPFGGSSGNGRATASCYCQSVVLDFPLEKPGFVQSFVCHCTDCHKIHASVFGANFIVRDTHLVHVKGQELLTAYSNNTTIITKGNTMTNYFCSKCGSLMYRRGSGFPGNSILRIGTVDDFKVMDNELRPTVEQFIKDKTSWVGEINADIHDDGFYYGKL